MSGAASTAAARRAMWRTWNIDSGAITQSATQTLPGDVLYAARRSPGATALRQGERTVTYGELADEVAARTSWLLAAGVTPGDKVLVLASRGIDFVVDALAIMNAGAAYVPIDSALPRARIEKFVEVARAVGLVARERFADLAAMIDGSWWDLDSEPASRSARSSRPSGATAHGLAYMIFTSGSTGAPKAVCLDHSGRASMIADLNHRLEIGADDAMLVVSSPSFDMSVFDAFGVLAAGGRVVFPDEGRENDVEHWADLIVEERVTLWHSVPSAMALVLSALKRRGEIVENMRVVLLGGDWIPVSQPDLVRRHMPAARVISLGGATEASVDSVIYETRPDDAYTVAIPYGRSLDRQTAYVLNNEGDLADVGEVGELALGGVGVAWGYHAQPALTASRFIPDAFGDEAGQRLYLTGDAARLDGSGEIHLLGRLDQQVKVGGVRVELGEIDALLRTVPVVAEACTVATIGGAATAALASFVTRAEGVTADDEAIARECRATLYEALHASMVPGQISVVSSLPLSPNGKIDRPKLQAWALRRPALKSMVTPHRNLALVASVWSEILDGAFTSDTSETFADLGGTSLAAAQVVLKINEVAGTALRLRDVMQARTIKEVADLLTIASVASTEEMSVDATSVEMTS